MYIVVTTPIYPTGNGLTYSSMVTIPSIEYYQTKEQLMARLKKGGNIRVFEATELNYQLDVKLTPKTETIPDIRYR